MLAKTTLSPDALSNSVVESAETTRSPSNSVVESCPAFADGCPFSKVDLAALPTILSAVGPKAVEGCLAFKDGCPFKKSDSVEGLYNKLAEMPASHRVGADTSAAKAVTEVLQMVHEQSKMLKAKLNAQCPVFATSCPFKTVTSDGAPLVMELDKVVTAWGLSDDQQGPLRELDEPLSKLLKAGTKSVHRAAENVRFVRDFLSCKVPKDSYVELLQALYHVYDTLESALKQLPAEMAHCDFSVLSRTGALREDLRCYLGLAPGEAMDIPPPSRAAAQYVQRLRKISEEKPILLLAHAYTRYLGDLSGGQILARAATKAYQLQEGCGTAFYNFADIGSSPAELKAFKKHYRASLDNLKLGQDKADALVEEANTAFIMNMLIFEERDVAAGHLGRTRSLDEVLVLVKDNVSPLAFQRAYAGNGSETGGAKKGAGKCPFLPAAAQGDGGPAAEPAGERKTCPWPFIWLHDPKAALAVHPAKNVLGVAVLLAVAKAAWRFPRRVGLGVLGLGLLSMMMRPKKHRKPESK